MTRDKAVAYLLAMMCGGLYLFGPAEAQQGPTQNDRIAAACVPAEGERVVVSWEMNNHENQVLVFSKQKFIGTRAGDVQYAILESSEIK